jgi:hypothetical protein
MNAIRKSQPVEAARRTEAADGIAGIEKPVDRLTIKYAQVGAWWTATVHTPDGTLVGTGPTRQLAQDDLDWLLMSRSEKADPPT